MHVHVTRKLILPYAFNPITQSLGCRPDSYLFIMSVPDRRGCASSSGIQSTDPLRAEPQSVLSETIPDLQESSFLLDTELIGVVEGYLVSSLEDKEFSLTEEVKAIAHLGFVCELSYKELAFLLQRLYGGDDKLEVGQENDGDEDNCMETLRRWHEVNGYLSLVCIYPITMIYRLSED